MILRIAERKKLLALRIDASVIERIPELIRQTLALEPQIREVAKKIAPLSRIVLFGAGVGWPTAREGALKIKESCYIAAEGFETEEVLHGPFSEIDSRAALIGLLTGRPSDDRARQILRAAGELKTQRLAIVTPSANHDISAEHTLVVPEASPETRRVARRLHAPNPAAVTKLFHRPRTRPQSRHRPPGPTRPCRRQPPLQILARKKCVSPQIARDHDTTHNFRHVILPALRNEGSEARFLRPASFRGAKNLSCRYLAPGSFSLVRTASLRKRCAGACESSRRMSQTLK